MLSVWFVEDVANDHHREACLSFATPVIHDLLRQGHGALVAVVEKDTEIPQALSYGRR